MSRKSVFVGLALVLVLASSVSSVLARAQAPQLVLLDARLGREAFALARQLLRLPADAPYLMLVAGPRLVGRPLDPLDSADFGFYRLSRLAPTSLPFEKPAVG